MWLYELQTINFTARIGESMTETDKTERDAAIERAKGWLTAAGMDMARIDQSVGVASCPAMLADFHLSESSETTSLREENERLRAALEHYADESNWGGGYGPKNRYRYHRNGEVTNGYDYAQFVLAGTPEGSGNTATGDATK